ncbi:MAG: DUF1566 domain-containing protein [Bacteroidales bacterium]
MRKLITIVAIFLFTIIDLSATVPELMSYQAIIRDVQGNILCETPVDIRISIEKGNGGHTVYTETHSVVTNMNGLLTVEIGRGTSSSSLSDIDWGKDSYFIKLEIDWERNGNYSIIGSSQLLSVPYALHAKTAEQIINTTPHDTLTESDSENTHYVGEPYEGGIIVWLDKSKKHGLIAGLENLSISTVWSTNALSMIGETAQSKCNGLANSQAISSEGGSAAKICLDYTNPDKGTGSFSDWYLPSIEELKKLWINLYELETTRSEETDKEKIMPVLDGFYWSSTEHNEISAWGFNFYNGNAYTSNKFTSGCVRGFRKF